MRMIRWGGFVVDLSCGIVLCGCFLAFCEIIVDGMGRNGKGFMHGKTDIWG